MSTILNLAEDRAAALDKAAETLQAGSVVVLPVDGVYAIVADAFRAAATQRIFAARRRSRATPLPVLLRTERQLGALAGDVPEYADRLIAAYWPGDLTLILPATQDLSWDLGSSKGTVQLRLPADEVVRELILRIGPLACTSANRLEQERPRTAQEAKVQLGVLVPVYLDAGELDGHVSTIVDCTGEVPVVHREGAIPESHVQLVAAGELPWGERPDPDDVPAEPSAAGEPAEASDAQSQDGAAVTALDPDVVADLEAQADQLVEHAEELEERLAREHDGGGASEDPPPPDGPSQP